MYRYDHFDQIIVNERVQQFRDQTRRFLAGELTDDEFRPLRLRNGLYIQRYAPMLRVAVPYGLLRSQQVRMLAHIARRYDRNYAHVSTRQNIQYNWPALENVPDILEHLASVQMHSIQTSGNCVRNITADHLAGVAIDEIEDPRPYCEIMRQWSTFHPEFNWLPRKFKIGVSGALADRAAVQWHDIGLYLVKNSQGEVGFKVLVGGGMGRMPMVAVVVREFLEKKYLFSYLEAILRIYNLEGRRDNIHRARIKVLVKSLGAEKFREKVEAEWLRTRDGLILEDREIERFKSYFTPPAYDRSAADDKMLERHIAADPAFATWIRRNTRAHKIAGYRAVFVSLKAPEVAPGDITSEQMEAVADMADKYSFGEVRSTHDQNLLFSDVQQAHLYALWNELKRHDLATPNIGTLTDMICCPGLDFCSLANASSISIARQINERFTDLDYLYDLGEIQLKMSGCMNACGHHHAGHIGILGVDKDGVEFYQIQLGGSAGNDAAEGERIGPALAKEGVAAAIAKILEVFVEQRQGEELFLECVRRVGIEPFKVRVYAGAENKKVRAYAHN
ncbi:MAG: nitrite/sulfite reductase [Gammaproteobacteria bacterium]|nr:nitrite/sulfite reductase [Gammaproteobacteria bacterium]MCG3143822.1 Sulfite reductase [ferredoxin] [Gammaproteobacteria bacterium]